MPELNSKRPLAGVDELQITIETRRIDDPLDRIKHTVTEINQTVGRRNSFAGALLRYSFKDLQMAICRLAQPLIRGGPSVKNPADAAEDRVQRPHRMFQKRLVGRQFRS